MPYICDYLLSLTNILWLKELRIFAIVGVRSLAKFWLRMLTASTDFKDWCNIDFQVVLMWLCAGLNTMKYLVWKKRGVFILRIIANYWHNTAPNENRTLFGWFCEISMQRFCIQISNEIETWLCLRFSLVLSVVSK